MKATLLTIFLTICLLGQTQAQVYANKVVGKKNEALLDSVKAKPYPYVLPIWGEKAAEKGFQLPYSAGVSVNYFWQESALLIDNLLVGFNNGPLYNMDEIVRFTDATSTANSLNIRPDIWLFPFLNIYGIYVNAKTSTEINAGMWLPDLDSTWSEVAGFSTKAEFDAQGLGFGMTPTIGISGGWLALDMNVLWTDVSALDKPVFTFVFGPRLGKTIQFKNPDMNLAAWVGGFRIKFSSETNGSINFNELFPVGELQAKVDQGFAKVDQTAQDVENWWNGLTPIEQNQPSNKIKYETANRAIDAAGNALNALDGALNDEQSASVQYSLDKKLKDQWNFIVGTQFQINRHFMLRAEYGFLGSRQQFVGGLQYRFGL